MNTLVIYPGRFHPFHKGHKMVYDWLVKQYGVSNVYIATTDSQAPLTSPFSFDEKYSMMTTLGVPTDKVVQVKNPYQAKEIIANFDPETTKLIFAVSEKDAERFTFAPKKDGSPGYLQPLEDKSKKPFKEHGYIMLVPTFTFKVAGQNANSATQIRSSYIAGNEHDRDQIIHDLYGSINPKIKEIFNTKLSKSEQVQEAIRIIKSSMLSEQKLAWLQKVLTLESTAQQEMNPNILNEDLEYNGAILSEQQLTSRRYRK